MPRTRFFHSLWFRLAWRGIAIIAVTAAIFFSIVSINASSIVGRLIESTLVLQSAQLLPYVFADENDTGPVVPDAILEAYGASSDTLIYAVLDRDGRVRWSSSGTVRGLLAQRPLILEADRTFFRITSGGKQPTSYTLLAQKIPDSAGSILIVGRGIPAGEGLTVALRSQAARHLEWIVFSLLAAALLAALWTLRSSLAPLQRISAQAHGRTAGTSGALLETRDLPPEMRRMVLSINEAFDRLTKAYEAHRSFTATVAHELRSPVTMLSLHLEELQDNPAAAGLRQDVERMKRLVEQLMGVVRTDTLPLATLEDVNLGDLARDVVATMAPGAAVRQVTLGLSAPHVPVIVTGDRLSLWLAVRNLVENGINHSPPWTEVEVNVGQTGLLSVGDHGAGVPLEDRQRIFERFWRRPEAPMGGTGLGLAIVSEVASQHGGSVDVTDARGGGALFTLRLPVKAPS